MNAKKSANMKRILCGLIVLLMVWSATPRTARAAEYTVGDGQTMNLSTGELTWTEGGALIDTYAISDGDTITISADAAATVTGTKNVLLYCCKGTALTLDSVTSNTGATDAACALCFTDGENSLTIGGNSDLASGAGVPGIRVEEGVSLEIKGEGSLVASGGEYGAGIGGGKNKDGGAVIVKGGSITARGGFCAAGIGGGQYGDGGTVNITGGTVTAAGGAQGAGIGCGDDGDGGNTTITGGSVTATGGERAAGIGGSEYGDGGVIKISGGTLNAKGGASGAGVGGGKYGCGGNITITGGTVTAEGGSYGAGIGGGDYGDNGLVAITGGTVDTTGGTYGAGIGGGDCGGGGEITISGGTVTATGGKLAAGIGGGDEKDSGILTITDTANVQATGGESGAGIGGGWGGSVDQIMITGGRITAEGGSYGAGIGGGETGYGGEITITGDTDITAMGGMLAAGIGGGNQAGGGSITIAENAKVNAAGGAQGAGIGGGEQGDGGNIMISGNVSIVSAGGDAGAGIGGGWVGGAGAIDISGGSVQATGSGRSAGIGGGDNGDGGTVSIGGGIVYAIKDTDGSFDIGQGPDGEAGTIDITGNAAVLLGTDTTSPDPPAAPAHTHYAFSQPTADAYGIPVPAGWTNPFGAYLVLYEVSYDANGGSGSVPAEEKAAGAKIKAPENPFTYAEHEFTGWNTKADGSGTDYEPGDTFTVTGDVTLFAQWYAPVQSVTLDRHSLTMATGATCRLSATIVPDGTGAAVAWTSSNEEVATVENGVVKAVKAGSATITAKAEEKSDNCAVTVTGPRPGPTPKPAPSPTAGIEAEEKKTEVIIEEVIIEKEVEAAPSKSPMQEEEEAMAGETVRVTIQTAGLPKGAKALFLPDGRVVEIEGDGEIEIEIDSIYMPKGLLQVIPIGEGNTLLGVYSQDGEAVFLPDPEAENGFDYTLMWTLIIIAGACAAGYLIWRKIRVRHRN